MSQIHYDEVPLESLVDSAEHILVVRPDEPAFRLVEVPIGVPSNSGEAVPPFSYRVQRYVVDAVVRGSDALSGSHIEVEPAGLSSQRRDHYDYYVIGLSKHPIVRAYAHRSDLTDLTNGFVAFLCGTSNGFCFSMSGAVEGVEHLDEIRQLAAQRGRMQAGEVFAVDAEDDD